MLPPDVSSSGHSQVCQLLTSSLHPPTSVDQSYTPQLLPSPAHPSAHAYSQVSEPALILVSPTGDGPFWPSIFLRLAGGDKFTPPTLPPSLNPLHFRLSTHSL